MSREKEGLPSPTFMLSSDHSPVSTGCYFALLCSALVCVGGVPALRVTAWLSHILSPVAPVLRPQHHLTLLQTTRQGGQYCIIIWVICSPNELCISRWQLSFRASLTPKGRPGPINIHFPDKISFFQVIAPYLYTVVPRLTWLDRTFSFFHRLLFLHKTGKTQPSSFHSPEDAAQSINISGKSLYIYYIKWI